MSRIQLLPLVWRNCPGQWIWQESIRRILRRYRSHLFGIFTKPHRKKMLSKKVIDYCKAKGWWFDDVSSSYADVMRDLGIPHGSAFASFYSHAEGDPAFYSRKREIYQIGWFSINSQYKLDIKRTHELLHLPDEYLPLDSFEGESGFFYNRETGEVAELSLGRKLNEFLVGDMQPQWKSFNEFLEWYFELN